MAVVVVVAQFGPSTNPGTERGLTVHLPLTGHLKDHSAFHHTVKVHGQVDLEGEAARFPGNGSWLELPHIRLERRPFAIALWVKLVGSRRMYGLLDQRDESAFNRHLHLMLEAGRPMFGQFGNQNRGATIVQPGVWTHLTFRYTGRAREIWVNCLRVVSDPTALAYHGIKGTTNIGRDPGLASRPAADFDGFMRELRIYEGLVSEERLFSLCEQSPP
jgi:Concanavalin A-like lectin/glucanases superfamily